MSHLLQHEDVNEDSDGSQHGRKNNQNTFSWSSTSSSNSTLLSSHSIHEQEEELLLFRLPNNFNDLNRAKKIKSISEILCRSASIGDLNTIQQIIMDSRLSLYINLDASDSDNDNGSTPLIYASCFGKLNVVKYLLELGVKVDIQDKIGWTALMWATTNGHSQIVKLLLEYSASSNTKSVGGRTIYDLVDLGDEKLISILSLLPTTKRRISSISVASINNNNDDGDDDDDELLLNCEASFRSVHKFIWDQCLPDQMFVFAEQEIDHILNVAISELKLPMKTRLEIYVPANIIFLCARFAHYFTSRELLSQLLTKSVNRIEAVVKANLHDIHTLAFWIANLSQLLYYLKKDAGLVVATAEYQLEISELISESYTLLVIDSEKRMDRILESAMIEFEQLSGLEVVDFQDDWHRFFRRSTSRHYNRKSFNSNDIIILQQLPTNSSLSPQSITSLLTSILYVLQSYDVHPVIVIQAMAQLFHFLSCEIFNRILCNKKYLCRSKALQIRMNLTIIEEWVRENQLPITLSAYFNPAIQLVQLLQCVSQLQDLMDFINTTKSFDLLNPMQIKRLVLNYRYEVSEVKLPEEIEKYTMQIAEDTVKSNYSSFEDIIVDENNNSRPNSTSSLGSLLQSISLQKKNVKNNNRLSIQSIDSFNNNNSDDYSIGEKRDSKYMLPFSLPTTTNMIHSGWKRTTSQTLQEEEQQQQQQQQMSLSDTIYFELKNKLSAEREKNARETSVIPSIPEEWLDKLDHP